MNQNKDKNNNEDENLKGNAALLVEYDKRHEYELKSIDRRWQMLTVFIAVSGFSLAIFKDIEFKLILCLFNVFTGLCSIAYYIQVRSRAYDNALRLKQIAEKLGIVGLVHINRRESLFRFGGVSFYVITFMIILVVGWCIILLSRLYGFKLP